MDRKPENLKSIDVLECLSTTLAELGDSTYFELIQNTDKVVAKISGEKLNISVMLSVNACGNYECMAEMSGDSLYLDYIEVSGQVCTSRRIDNVKFVIDKEVAKNCYVVLK